MRDRRIRGIWENKIRSGAVHDVQDVDGSRGMGIGHGRVRLPGWEEQGKERKEKTQKKQKKIGWLCCCVVDVNCMP